MGFDTISSRPLIPVGLPVLTGTSNIFSASSTAPSISDPPPVKTMPVAKRSKWLLFFHSCKVRLKISSIRGSIMEASTLREISLGSPPPTAGTRIISSESTRLDRAEP
jgi:hypothetical protein